MNVDDNKRVWDGRYHWADRGDEWSEPWGGPARQWHGSILPRLLAFLPAGRILEIACGCGRITQFLKDWCSGLVGVDLSEQCVRACRERFEGDARLMFHVTDGKSLAMIEEASVDLAFSFDSLVHADETVLDAYLGQLPRLLREEGVAFIHHSNLGEYRALYARIRGIPRLEGLLKRLGLLDETVHWRDETVDAEGVRRLAERHGLCCVSQEIFRWRTRRIYNDCISVLVRKDAPRAGPLRRVRNKRFMDEADNLLALSRLYR